MSYTKYHDPWHNADTATGGGDETTPLTAAALDWIEAGIEAADLAALQAPRANAITSLTAQDVPVWNGSSWVRPSGTATAAKFLRGDGSWALPVSAATALPGSPVDGQLALLTDSLTAPTYQWMFRYNAGSASSYKWEFVGGSPAINEVATTESPGSFNAWVNLATNGPLLTIPRAGEYVCSFGVSMSNGATGAQRIVAGMAVGDTSATAPLADTSMGGAGPNAPVSSVEYRHYLTSKLTLAASDVLKVRYNALGNTAASFARRSLAVHPVRVS